MGGSLSKTGAHTPTLKPTFQAARAELAGAGMVLYSANHTKWR
jgi:hypothetical protein